jgi:hypothetical protein
MLAAGMLLVLIVIVSVVISLVLRSWGTEQSRTEARMHDPRIHTIPLAVPDGVGPVVVRAAVGKAGFNSGLDRLGQAEWLIVECRESERSRLRSDIEAVHLPDYDGTELAHGHVVFEDER